MDDIELEQLIESNIFALTYDLVFDQLQCVVCKLVTVQRKPSLRMRLLLKLGRSAVGKSARSCRNGWRIVSIQEWRLRRL